MFELVASTAASPSALGRWRPGEAEEAEETVWWPKASASKGRGGKVEIGDVSTHPLSKDSVRGVRTVRGRRRACLGDASRALGEQDVSKGRDRHREKSPWSHCGQSVETFRGGEDRARQGVSDVGTTRGRIQSEERARRRWDGAPAALKRSSESSVDSPSESKSFCAVLSLLSSVESVERGVETRRGRGESESEDRRGTEADDDRGLRWTRATWSLRAVPPRRLGS